MANDKETFRVAYHGLGAGKTYRAAIELALQVKSFFANGGQKIQIEVFPAELINDLKADLKKALGHSNCYCPECKKLSEKYFHLKPIPFIVDEFADDKIKDILAKKGNFFE